MRARVEHSKQPTAALCGSDQDEAPGVTRKRRHVHAAALSALGGRREPWGEGQLLRPRLGLRPWLALLRRTLAFFFWVRFDMAHRLASTLVYPSR